MRKKWIFIIIFSVAITVLAAYYIFLRIQWTEDSVLYRAQIARMLALIHYDKNECEQRYKDFETELLPKDISNNSWYDKYAVTAIEEGWMKVYEDELFYPGNIFTYKDLKEIMKAFYITEESLSFPIRYFEDDAMVPSSRWYEVFRLITVNMKKIEKNTYWIYSASVDSDELLLWQVMTDQGIKEAEGVVIEPYIGTQIEAYTVGDHILGIVGQIESEGALASDSHELLEDTESENIYVILHEKEGDYEHDRIRITSDEPFYVMNGQDVWKYDSGKIVEFNRNDPMMDQGNVYINTISEDGKIKIISLERSSGIPEYNGQIILERYNEEIIIVNKVNLEDYVSAVLPGEMPVSYGMEALKAQAVCTRTFAKRALDSTFQSYPAHVDDTVLSQVYNNQPSCERSIQAVYETKGIVLKSKGTYTPTYFFSTSCGHTSSAEEVWYDGTNSLEKENHSVFLTNDEVEYDLSNESDFRAFINMEKQFDYFEEDLPWFRWQVYIDHETIESKVKEQTHKNIGRLLSVEILERGNGGVIKSILIKGDKGEITILGEYKIRKIFSPKDKELRSHTGMIVTDWNILPSGYFYLDALVEDGLCDGYLLRGGGYGHGCGLSQNGAMKMAELGKNYVEILNYFFTDAEIVQE